MGYLAPEICRHWMQEFAAAIFMLVIMPSSSFAQIDCNKFWSGGLALEGHPGGPVWCEEYTPGEESDALLVGSDYRIFVDANLNPGDLQPELGWMAEAIDDTVGAYSWIEGKPPFFIFVSSVPRPVGEGFEKYVVAAASRNYRDGEPCPILFYPIGMLQDYQDFKQTVAHEAFHCVQSTLFWPQLSGGTNNLWWTEGTATYFSNIVYPDFNEEWPFSGDYDPGGPNGNSGVTLFDQAYQINFFFQDLSNRIGKEGIIQLLQAMPTTPGRSAQQDALAAFPDIGGHWHSFGQNYLDKRVNDTGVLIVDVNPDKGETIFVDESSTELITVDPFTLNRRRIIFAPGHSFRVTVETGDGSGMYSTREVAEGADWSPMPDMILTECDSSREYQFLATSAVSSTAPLNLLTVNFELMPSCSCEKPRFEFDGCIVGTWKMDVRTMDELIETMLDSKIQRRPTEGHHTMAITKQGIISGNHSLTDVSIINIPPADPQELRHTRTGTYKALVQNASKTTLMFCNVKSEFNSEATMNGIPMKLGPLTQFSQSPDPVFSDVEGYSCSNNELRLRRKLPNGVSREFLFYRVH